MRIAITGGTGFIGTHLGTQLASAGHEVVVLSRGARPAADRGVLTTDLSDAEFLRQAFADCDAVAHCAGINREIGAQTFQKVHVEATRNVVSAALAARVPKIVLMSFLRARPNCGSPYHESKWAAEEIVRTSGLDYTIIRAGMVYGRGDHMLDHLSHAIHTIPVFATVGMHEKPIRPLAIQDLVAILGACSVDGRLSCQTVGIVGAEELLLSEAVGRVAGVLGRRIFVLPCPVAVQFALA